MAKHTAPAPPSSASVRSCHRLFDGGSYDTRLDSAPDTKHRLQCPPIFSPYRHILIDSPYQPDDINLKTSSATTEDYQLQPEMTYWGPALRLRAPLSFNNPMVLGACRLSSWQRYCAVASINRHLTGAGSIAPEKTVQVIDVITEM
ncbi:hypothetical protein [Yersinia enterocolitica]|uniref:hypothetical protein n=1 Tax=Yersinia enterocolitica TaxID=630 RepID=UPI0005E3B9EC|nr:hypothetical protein [Yersinia enterocolitica]CNE56452.1 L-carnitine dehydratase/bile acid-inducible protein F [Yersinia enterocolitica]